MVNGRVYTLEDEIDGLHEDLGRARRRLNELERARHDGRMCNEPEVDQGIWRLRQRVRALEVELAEKIAEQRAGDVA